MSTIATAPLITNSMELSPSLEADSRSVGQEIPRLMWNPVFITAVTRARNWTLS